MSKIRVGLLLLFLMVGSHVMVASALEEVPHGEEPLTTEQLEAFEAELVRPEVADCTDSGVLNYISLGECEALADLYNNTRGQQWTNSFSSYNVPWFTSDYPCNWTGVDCIGGISSIYLDDKGLRGDLPESIGNLIYLRKLQLTNNRLTGEIPPTIGNLSNITTLALRGNVLSGEIPAEIGNLSSVRWLHLEDNILEGAIPAEIGNLTTLRSLDLSLNGLTGNIPAELGNLQSLQYLHLHDNLLSGEIPAGIGNLGESIRQIELSRNTLTGTLPAELGNLTVHQFFKAQNNQLSGVIPSEMEAMRAESLDLSDNQIVGPLPTNLNDFYISTSIDLARNTIDGALPADLDFARTNYINLEHNRLSGEVDVNDVAGSNFSINYNMLRIVGSHSLSYYYSTHQIIPNNLQLISEYYPSDPLTVRLNWNSNPYRTVTPHSDSELEYATSPDGPWTVIDINYGRQYWMTFPEYDTTYYVRVRMRDFNSGVPSTDIVWTEYSDTLEVKTVGSVPPVISEFYHLNPYEDPYTARIFWGNTTYNHVPGHYILSYATDPAGPWFENAVTTDTRQDYGTQITFPEADMKYYVRMQSVTQFPGGDLVTDHSNIIEVQTAVGGIVSIPTITSGVNQHTIIMDRYYFAIAATLLAIATLILVYPQKQRD